MVTENRAVIVCVWGEVTAKRGEISEAIQMFQHLIVMVVTKVDMLIKTQQAAYWKRMHCIVCK